ncbi:MAG: hypothetical protein INH41_24330 [Myxococcaceae bacterium]|jgi:hypothetical protein|nr:hypothetical protein [Myxococcaceae bacterium]MCA3015530.1 hypothetical protein [Myxococcaceae bacterium]
MAARKTKPAKKPASRKTPGIPHVALKLLETLPPLDARRRRAYLGAFTDAQCEAWGARTKAEAVVREAERFVGAVAAALSRPVTGYGPARLAWLCTLVTELHDSVEVDKAAPGTEARAGLLALADTARKKLATGLVSAGTGDDAFLQAVADRDEPGALALESTLTGLLQLALRLRRTEHGELLADDAGLSEAFLSSVSALTDALRDANERAFTAAPGHDSAETNRVEGRVLREMAFALAMLRRARADGERVTVPAAGPELTAVSTPPSVAT